MTPSESPGEVAGGSGWLAVNLRVRYEGSLYTEGAVSFVELRDAASGETVGRVRSKRARIFLRQQLTPGEYDVRTFLRPCDGSCKALDAPRDECRLAVEMLADGSNRFVTVGVVAVSGVCAVSDKGDTVDFDTPSPESKNLMSPVVVAVNALALKRLRLPRREGGEAASADTPAEQPLEPVA